MSGLRSYLLLAGASLRARMQYKFNFIATTLGYALITLMDFLIVAAILYRFRVIAGWDMYEVALLTGAASASYGLYRAIGTELETFERYLITGEFDSVMTRPWPTLLTLLTRGVDFTRLGATIQGYAVLTLSAGALTGRGELAGWQVGYLYLLPLTGAVILGSLALAAASAGFWITRIEDLLIFSVNAPYTAACYPLEIYPGWLRGLLFGALPTAFIAYVPARYLLGRGGHWAHLLLPPAAAGAAALAAYAFWRRGERQYQSAGN